MVGTLMIFSTGLVREYYVGKLKVWDHRVFSPLALAGGILFFLAAPTSSQPTFIVILGVLSLAKGLLLMFGPHEKIKRLMHWWFEASEQLYRIWGLLALVLGVAVLVTIIK
jgi:uncharacterized protein YjeT (DUF2065 family)